MTEPYLGEIQAFAFGFCPTNWQPCDGRVLPIQGNSALFALIGTYYGGNGTTNFALPNLVGSVAVSQGQGPGLSDYPIGSAVGQDTVALTSNELPTHTHGLQLGDKASANSTAGPSATSNVAIDPAFNGFAPPPGTTTLSPLAVTLTGGNAPHPNMQPTLAMIYCIATVGTFPSFG